jgi:3-isopropylmalate/(R)-2-methylmalate dehydratase small subunit
MTPFERLEAVAAPMLQDNIDTDAIVPVSHMKELGTELGRSLFANARYHADGSENPEFVLNRPEYRSARLLVSGSNFGCGSSREHAVWALLGFGIRCVVADSYGGIFYDNSFRMGLLPVVLAPEKCRALGAAVASCSAGARTVVDLEAQEIIDPDQSRYRFDIEPRRRRMLLDGLDATGMTLLHGAEIDAFQARDRVQRPWVYETLL